MEQVRVGVGVDRAWQRAPHSGRLVVLTALARSVARKLAIRFVSDTPSAALVNHLAGVYLRPGTDIAAVLRALVRHKEFMAAVGCKVRTPADDLVQTVAHRTSGPRLLLLRAATTPTSTSRRSVKRRRQPN